ncbi:MAG: hypothetical protein IPK72_00165 [Candidatus Eisenbacteria bacterium]|nr:hypothetical protein [Candidatus Eisenbacteria bacterium]
MQRFVSHPSRNPLSLSVAAILMISSWSAASGQGAPTGNLQGSGLERAIAIEREVSGIAARGELWPGFDLLSIPLAIYTGEETYLFRHPAPPQEFELVPRQDAWVRRAPGRYPSVSANTSVDLGGVSTATLMAENRAISPARCAEIAAHESFHVFQRAHHPSWSGNEGDLFLYPTEEAGGLALRRMESVALANALAASEDAVARCWARTALGHRAHRFAAIDSTFSRYERATELNEGLATYVELRAAERVSPVCPPGEFGATAIRERCYWSGAALGFLLDRLRPDWVTELEVNDRGDLDLMLHEAIAYIGSDSICKLSRAESDRLFEEAKRDVEAVSTQRAAAALAFDTLPGWRVTVELPTDAPLWPQGFDPLNVQLVDGGVLHARMLTLANDQARLEMLDTSAADLVALTVAAGAHPLWNGISRVTVAGLGQPEVTPDGDGLRVTAPGLELRVARATSQTVGQQIQISTTGKGR